MADLLNLLEHKKNTKVLVNGTVYDIGPDGVARNVAEPDAAKLLQNLRVWKIFDPKKAKALKAKAKKEAKGKMQLLGADGPIGMPDKPGDPMDPNLDVYKRPDPTANASETREQPEAIETAETKEEAEAEPEDESGESPQSKSNPPPAQSADSSLDNAWPDPNEDMDIEYLRDMAAAYEVVHNKRTPKKTLVSRIHAAMYE